MTADIEKVVSMRKFMDENLSPYTYSEDLHLEKRYRYVDYEGKSLAFINGEVNTISDCFIIYAISILGCAEPSVIADFLVALRKHNPELQIVEFTKDTIKPRIAALKKHGFLFNICYTEPDHPDTGDTSLYYHSLLTAGKDAISLMNARLRKQIKPNSWVMAKPNDELLGIAASASVFTCLMKSPNLLKFETAIFKGRNTGTVKLDGEFISEVDNQKYYVGIMSVYLHKNSTYMTENDYKDLIDYKLNVINDYIRNRTKKGIAKMILVCESNKDMVRIANAIIKSNAFEQEALDNIHFTSAGLVSGYGKGPEDWFLNLKLDEKEKNGFTYELSKRFV